MTGAFEGKACVSSYMGKRRPVLILAKADSSDYVALPISRVTSQRHISPSFDYPLEIADYPSMNLKAKSYVRAHKQFVVNAAEIKETICDFRCEYPGAYADILALVKRFQQDLQDNAL